MRDVAERTIRLSVLMPVSQIEKLKGRAADTAQTYPTWTLSHELRAELKFLEDIGFSPLNPPRIRRKAVGEN